MNKLVFNFIVLFASLVVSTSFAAEKCLDLYQAVSARVSEAVALKIEDRSKEEPLTNFLEKTPDIEALNVEVKPLYSASEGLAAKIAVIERAKHSIDISYYILRYDTSARAILLKLREAIDRGVKIRILVDGAGSFHKTHAELQALRQYGLDMNLVEIKIINPMISIQGLLQKCHSLITRGEWNFDPLAMNKRSHDKILLVDVGTKESYFITGGRNVYDQNYGVGGRSKEILDYEAIYRGGKLGEVEDPLVAIRNHYEAVFYHRLNFMISGRIWGLFRPNDAKILEQQTQAIEQLENTKRYRTQLDIMRGENYWKQGFEKASGLFFSQLQNIVGEAKVKLSLAQSIPRIVAEAKQNIDMISPYPLLSKRDVGLIREWLLANPEATFNLYTNSYRSMDNPVVYAMFHIWTLPRLQALQKDPVIGERVKIYLFDREKRLMHMKAVLLDGKTSLITTHNFDPRGNNFNSEIGIWDNSRANANAIQQKIIEIKSGSELAPPTGVVLKAKDANERARQNLVFYIAHVMRLFQAQELF